MGDILKKIIQETLIREISPSLQLNSLAEESIRSGMSGANLKRFTLKLHSFNYAGVVESHSIITKETTLKERLVLFILHKQGMNVPFNYSNNLSKDATDIVCMQDLGNTHLPDPKSIHEDLLKKEGLQLARIHAENFNQESQYTWLPKINRQYIDTWLQKGWRNAWIISKKDEAFVEEFNTYIQEVERSAQYIVEDMEQIINDHSSSSLIHTDIHGGNVLLFNEEVYFIDWQEAHYGPIYLDLPNIFCTSEQVQYYYEALTNCGVNISESHFYSQYTICRRYIGLRYMGWLLHIWKQDQGAAEWIVHHMKMAIE